MWDDRAGEGPLTIEIGMRWGELWRLVRHPWVAAAFARMYRAGDGRGLAVRAAGPVVVQHWRSRAALDAWARDPGAEHQGPWARFAREVGGTADWGVWHVLREAQQPATMSMQARPSST
jgi:hypothetical protein